MINSLDKTCNEEYSVKDFDKIITDVLKMDIDQREDRCLLIKQRFHFLGGGSHFVKDPKAFARNYHLQISLNQLEAQKIKFNE